MTNETKEKIREEWKEFVKDTREYGEFPEVLVQHIECFWLSKLDLVVKEERARLVEKIGELPCRGEAVFDDGTNDIGLSRSEVISLVNQDK